MRLNVPGRGQARSDGLDDGQRPATCAMLPGLPAAKAGAGDLVLPWTGGNAMGIAPYIDSKMPAKLCQGRICGYLRGQAGRSSGPGAPGTASALYQVTTSRLQPYRNCRKMNLGFVITLAIRPHPYRPEFDPPPARSLSDTTSNAAPPPGSAAARSPRHATDNFSRARSL